jgi:hypothetical protein
MFNISLADKDEVTVCNAELKMCVGNRGKISFISGDGVLVPNKTFFHTGNRILFMKKKSTKAFRVH